MPVFHSLLRSKLLLLLLLLCFTDALFTDIGLRLAYIQEMNPLIRSLYDWQVAAYYAVKLIFPIILLILHPYIHQKMWVQPSLTLLVIIYAGVNAYHCIWLTYGLTYLAGSS